MKACLVTSFLLVVSPALAVSEEMMVGPISYQQDVNGVAVNLSATTYFQLSNTAKEITLKARVVGDLTDLQKKIGQIVDTFALPSDNCKSFSGNNPVVNLPRKELLYREQKAVFSVGGTVDMWDCRENPVPNSKVEWKLQDVGFGIKTKVPVVVTWPGSPIKNKLGSQSFDVDLPLAITHATDSLSLVIEKPAIDLKGQYAFITEGILKIAGIDINQKAHDALEKAIDPNKLRVAIPEELGEFHPQIDGAKFVDLSGNLAIEISLSASVPLAELTNIVSDLVKQQ
ncbi:hypothetical protein [Rhizobium leguminosarum]|uniref:DUF4403 family protein n=1 Tax=Rhizobium leguminosarum TaxID=384 RepID=A0A7M3DQH2_RHILE|nr:hypothetical protein [Rhizobium leguminosarum]TAY50941.1 hypothetical protein ELH90_04075 [Rhizobium leguminosarum]